jgi:hypothetical protein
VLLRHLRQPAAGRVGIAAEPKRDGYREECNGCGLKLLVNLHAKAATIGVTEAGRIQASMDAQFAAGLTSATVIGLLQRVPHDL